MRGFTKAGKLFTSIMIVILLAAIALLVYNVMTKGNIMLAAIAVVGSLGATVWTFHIARKERDAREKMDEEDSFEDETDYDDMTDF